MSKQQITAFLEQKGLDANSINLDLEIESFLANMQSGLAHEQAAMNMIPTYIEVGHPIPVNEPVIVIDAGGTNFRVCTVAFDEDYNVQIEGFHNYRMPGTEGSVSREAFYDQVVSYIRPFLSKSRKIGFCFSYACEMYPNRDGKVLNFSKEVELPEVVGTVLGEEIREALQRAGEASDVEVCILNDTVAALLGGMSQTTGRNFEAYIGYILGTGTNTAYTEWVRNIGKLNLPDDPGRMIINMEAGTYPDITLTDVDREIDATTQNPNSYQFEKVVSGRYQGMQLWHTLHHAIEAGLFSSGFAAGYQQLGSLESYELDQFLYRPQGENRLAQICQTDEERLDLYYLIDNLFERSARLATINLAGVMKHMGDGMNPLYPVAISAEGTTFYKAKLLKPKIDFLMHSYTNEKLGLYHEFIRAENSNLIGAAIAALTNL